MFTSFFPRVSSVALWVGLLTSKLGLGVRADSNDCKCFPGDACWPSELEWAALNSSISGRLIKTVPLGSPCHDPNYDAAGCAAFEAGYNNPDTFVGYPSGIMNPLFTNNSCDPFTPENQTCSLGNYPWYSIEVEAPGDISKGIAFATEYNIRLTIKNTGHDYMGKSTGAGSLSLWMHKVQATSFFDYDGPYYHGPAATIGAGLEGYQLNAIAQEYGKVFLAGACATVGTVGGYTQGGGHSPLSNIYGLSADQVLEWQVVDGTGILRTASRTENSDLFWALSGGGGGTYGVVYNVTMKAHTDTPIAGGSLNFTSTSENFWIAIEDYHTKLPGIVDTGVFMVASIGNGSFTGFIHGPNIPKATVESIFEPYLKALASLNITYDFAITQFDNYVSEYTGTRDVFHFSVGLGQAGGYLIPRSQVVENATEVTAVARRIASDGLQFKGFAVNVSLATAGDVDNAVLPAWRDTLIHAQVTLGWTTTTPYAQMVSQANVLTDVYMPILKTVSGGGYAYMNEADSQEPDWKNAFFGSNYGKLLAIKDKYDPNEVFYANKAVGSDRWVAEELPNGRLCRA